MTNPGERYEGSIRVITVFFAALIGFGLKNLLDSTRNAPADTEADWWTLFSLAVLLFLRFLLGSVNHLSVEYVRTRTTTHTNRDFIFDLSFLVLLGILATPICYSKDVAHFLCWNLVYLSAGVIWGIFAAITRTHKTHEWPIWIAVNLIMIIPVIIVRLTVEQWTARIPFIGWRWTLTAVGICYAVGLLIDFNVQLKALESIPNARCESRKCGGRKRG